MGSFVGHIITGLPFIILSILWAINALKYYFNKIIRKNGGLNEKSYLDAGTINNPIESIVLIIVLLILIIGEFLIPLEFGGGLCPNNVQHITMYLFFLIMAIVNLMEIYLSSPLPSIFEPMVGVAFGVQTLLLYFHTHGQGPVEAHLHKLLTFASFMCTITSFLIVNSRTDIFLRLARSAFGLLQGIWLVHIAFLIFPFLQLISVQHDHNDDSSSSTVHHLFNTTTHLSNKTNNQFDHLNNLKSIYHYHEHDHHRSIMIQTAFFCIYFAFSIITMITLAFICHKKITKKQAVFGNEKYQRLLEDTSN